MQVFPGHVLFRVPPGRVEEAAHAWEHAGFTVVRGGPPHRLVNAMVYLADGWFIELFGLGSQPRVELPLLLARFIDPPMHERFSSLVHAPREGWLDWSVDVDDIQGARSELLARRVNVSRARHFRRLQSDGSTVGWELVMPAALPLPFLKSRYRGHAPIPASATVHANRVRGLGRLVVEASDVAAAHNQLTLIREDGPTPSGGIRIAGVEVHVQRGPGNCLREVALLSDEPPEKALSVPRLSSGDHLLIETVQA